MILTIFGKSYKSVARGLAGKEKWNERCVGAQW